MLLNLPVEIILEISGLLKFKSKLNLMITCRMLNDLISNAALYEHLDTVDRKQDAETIITRFKNKEINGSQVKTLNIFMRGLSRELMLQLPEIFTNLRRVTSDHDQDYEEEEEQYTANKKRFTENAQCNWIKTLEIYDTAKDWDAIWTMLKQYTFSRLVELNISDYEELQEQESEDVDEFYLVPYLKNTPSLKKLSLKDWTISLTLLDKIHAGCPFIETLELSDIDFDMDNDSLSHPIEPANSVLHLKLRDSINFDKEHLYLDYIPQKYPKLQYLYFDSRLNLSPAADEIAISILESYEDEESVRKELEAQRKTREDVRQTNRSRFISRLPKTIKTLSTPIADKHSLQAIAESGINIETLDISGGQTHNVRHLKSLRDIKTLQSLNVAVDNRAKYFIKGVAWGNITKLTFRYSRGYLFIDWLLSLFPSLQDLDITAYHGIASGNITQLADKTYPNLKTIRIQHSEVHPSFFTFLKQAAPNIKNLDMSCYNEKRSYSIDMTGWNLKKCSIHVSDRLAITEQVECRVTMQGISTAFIFMSPSELVMLSPDDDRAIKTTSSLEIVCDDIDNLKINTILLKRFGNKLYYS